MIDCFIEDGVGGLSCPFWNTVLQCGAKAFYSSRPDVCEWSPEGLYDKSVSWIPNTDEIL